MLTASELCQPPESTQPHNIGTNLEVAESDQTAYGNTPDFTMQGGKGKEGETAVKLSRRFNKKSRLFLPDHTTYFISVWKISQRLMSSRDVIAVDDLEDLNGEQSIQHIPLQLHNPSVVHVVEDDMDVDEDDLEPTQVFLLASTWVVLLLN